MSNSELLRPYASLHTELKGPGDQRPTASQIIADNHLQGALEGKVALVTGASAGIGVPTVLALLETGMRVFAAVRNFDKARASELGPHIAEGKLELIHLDNNSLASVRRCAEDFKQRSGGNLNLLINNAGIMMVPTLTPTEDGFESQLGVNYLSHFLLFQLLKPLLLRSATPDFPSRVVNVSSMAHRWGTVQLDNLQLEGEGVYDPVAAYGQSKTALIWMANEIERRYGSSHLHAFSLHPGGIWTNLQVHIPEEQMAVWKSDETVGRYMKSPAQGAATTIWAAVANVLEGKGGLYLEDCGVAGPVPEGSGTLDLGYASWAYDEEKEGKLWRKACALVGVEDN
ncbi:short-chain dehydrogenase [Westerdykella ornata]|uniref:Short-chain dehydrogenase n=1 Tax=Westerdykella ornata TaxID=318751 RepID=A0A6A6JXV9_WESOR|nr:short-chain dehydrogenase [Westerdykella ornata]KAF2281452.1 short-chain dehydrogenase [Westerdykella ornata]